MIFLNIIFLYPKLLWLSLLPFLIILLSRKKPQQEELIYFSHLDSLQKAFNHKISLKFSYKYIWQFVKLYLIWLLLVIALAQPNIIKKNKKIDTIGYDLMLLIDVSGSMEALDFSTEKAIVTRLDVTKKVVKDFIKKRQGDRIGIIIFGKFAYLESPLTVDNITLLNILEHSKVGIAGQETAIGDAITLGVSKLRNKAKNSKAIILLTDGENTAGKIMPITAAQLAKKYHIPIYTIGIGKNGEAPFLNQFRQLQYGYVTLDVTTLNEIANITGARYFNAVNQAELQKIYDEINKLTATKENHYITIKYQPIFIYPLYIALFLFCFFIWAKFFYYYLKNLKRGSNV